MHSLYATFHFQIYGYLNFPLHFLLIIKLPINEIVLYKIGLIIMHLKL